VITADFASKLAENKQLITHCQPVADKPFTGVVAEFVFGSDVVILPNTEFKPDPVNELYQLTNSANTDPEPNTSVLSEVDLRFINSGCFSEYLD
jgi:hypothetical protein